MKKHVLQAYYRSIPTQLFNPEMVSDKDLKRVLQSFVGADKSYDQVILFNTPLAVDIKNSTYVVKTECKDKVGEIKDASTLPRKNAEICFNINKLIRVPVEALRYQLIGLAFHEHAHHFVGDWELGPEKISSLYE